MKSSCLFKLFYSGPQVQMISIAKNDLRFYIVGQLLLGYCLYTSRRSHRHKNGSQDLTVIRGYFPGPCPGGFVIVLQLKA